MTDLSPYLTSVLLTTFSPLIAMFLIFSAASGALHNKSKLNYVVNTSAMTVSSGVYGVFFAALLWTEVYMEGALEKAFVSEMFMALAAGALIASALRGVYVRNRLNDNIFNLQAYIYVFMLSEILVIAPMIYGVILLLT